MLLRLVFISLFAAITAFSQNMPKIEPGVSLELAKWRAVQYSNISYKLNLTLEKMSPVLKGTIEIRVTQAAYACAEPNCPRLEIGLDWRKIPGHESDSTVSNVSINGTGVKPVPFRMEVTIWAGRAAPPPPKAPVTAETYIERDDHLIFDQGVVAGENVIKLDFTSPILTSGSAVTRYIDKEDGAEYIYSLFVPSDASTAFPCFDQPDLKARFSLEVKAPYEWSVVANTAEHYSYRSIDKAVPPDDLKISKRHLFDETQPISTYVFAFAAGPFQEFTDAGRVGGNPSGSEGAQRGTPPTQRTLPTGRVSASDASLPSHIYVRKSQAKKFEPHSQEVFRLMREGVRYLETYFDYKFPFPKLDLVLIPEFPFGGMEHAGAIFLREDRVIFPAEPTKGDLLTRANLIFHETAHQWFGDTVTMRWFDDLWLKEGFAEFMAYKTLEKVMPDANAWKVFYERNKQAAYATDSTRGTTPIYQPIANLSAAKSAYGNIVYRKAPSFLRQAEFYLGEDKFQTAVRAFLKKHEFGNAGWEDLVKEFERAAGYDLSEWSAMWIKQAGVPTIRLTRVSLVADHPPRSLSEVPIGVENVSPGTWMMSLKVLLLGEEYPRESYAIRFGIDSKEISVMQDPAFGRSVLFNQFKKPSAAFPNYQDYGYGIFLLDDKSRDYVLKNIQNEKDPFLRSMMWGALWDSVRESELDPKDYVELAIKNLPTETDETISQSILSRVSTAMNYYVAPEGGDPSGSESAQRGTPPTQRTLPTGRVSASTARLQSGLEAVLLDRLQHAPTPGLRVTFYRAFVTNATTAKGREVFKQMLSQGGNPSGSEGAQRGTRPNLDTLPTGRVSASTATMSLRTKDRFDIVTRLIVLGDPEAPKLLAGLEKTETSDDAKRYAYAAHAAFGTAENKAKFFGDFLNNTSISESWIESAIMPFNSISHAELTQQYLERSLKELPNLKRTRKIFFINNWLAAWIGGQRDEKALDIVNKFLADNPSLDNDLRLKILENVDLIERAVKIRKKYL